MWNIITTIMMAVEIILLVSFAIGRLWKRKLNETALFAAIVFAVNLALNLVPYLYNVIVLDEPGNPLFEVFGCIKAAVHMFVGEGGGEAALAFSKIVPLFAYAYLLAVAISLMTTVSAAIEAFGNKVRNHFRREKVLKQPVCDIVAGNGAKALQYAKNCNSVLLLDDGVSKEAAVALMEQGYVILRKGFTRELFKSPLLHEDTRYNLVCLDSEKSLDYIDAFIAGKKEATERNIHLYVELEEDKSETVRREIIEKNGCEAWITTFCTDELLARTFTEENPVTKYLSGDYIDAAAVLPDTQIHSFFLGFGKLSRQLYRQSILNNQLVTFENGTYRLLPLHYHICDTGVDPDAWEIGGLKEALGEVEESDCFPMPEMPYDTELLDSAPDCRKVLAAIRRQVHEGGGYTFVTVDTGADCRNIEIGARLKAMLFGEENYHIFIRSEAKFTEDEANITYFGKQDGILTHDVIVNDSLSTMAKRVNEVYTAQYAAGEKDRPDFADYVRKKAEAEWKGFDYFTLYSNIYAAMSLRLKLNLLGLDYTKDGKAEKVALIKQRHQHQGEYTFDAYFSRSVRNAIIAQEHARWNAYHLLSQWMPMEKSGITVKEVKGKKVRFQNKNVAAKKHACLTTYRGLGELSEFLAEKAGNGATAAQYDYYVYDEMLVTSAEELLRSLGYSVTEKENCTPAPCAAGSAPEG